MFDEVAPDLLEGMSLGQGLERAISWAQLRQLARHGDSLIARKCGQAESDEAAHLARDVFAAGWPKPPGWQAWKLLDSWMRSAGHARNPGTTADLIAAGLFVLLATGRLDVASPWGANRLAADQR